jgi:hypothetical protein
MVAGGICKMARAVLGMKFKYYEKCYFINIYVYLQEKFKQMSGVNELSGF